MLHIVYVEVELGVSKHREVMRVECNDVCPQSQYMGDRGRRVIVQGHPQLLSKFKVSLSYMRCYHKKRGGKRRRQREEEK